MNENKKLIVMGALIIVFLAVIPITAIISSVKSKRIVEKLENYIKSEELKLVYIGRDDCSVCQYFEPEIEFISEKYAVEYLYINTNDLKGEHLSKVLDILEIDSSDFGTPHLTVTKSGKKVAENPGYLSENKLFEFLQENSIINEDETLVFNYPDYDEYSRLIKSNSKEIIVIAQSGCSACLYERPILYKIAEKYNVKINYFNVSLISQEEGASFESSLSYLSENQISTPLTIIVLNNEVIDSLVGAAEEKQVVEFFKKNGFIKE